MRSAAMQFYESPDYSQYSHQPTDEHPQILVQHQHRKAHVDEKISALIVEVWRHGFDTVGSCQKRSWGENKGRAYIDFWIKRDADRFCSILRDVEIEFTVKEGQSKLMRKGADEKNAIPIDSANVMFSPNDIPRITDALKARADSSAR